MEFRKSVTYTTFTILCLFCQASLAQDAEAIAIGELFTWATTGESPDIFAGVMYALLGMMGALITIFGLIGGGVPGTAGYTEIEAGLNRLEARAKALDKLILENTDNASQIQAVQEANTNYRAQLSRERWRQFLFAASLYAILGAFFSSMLAQNIIQALIIGAGWTAYLGALGLKKDFARRKAIKDETTEKLEEVIKKGKSDISDDTLKELHVEAQVSKAL
jgi:hypothetical protein